MEQLVQQIILNSKSQSKSSNPRQMFFRQFDQAIQLAGRSQTSHDWSDCLNQLEQYGQAAGIPATEIARRKQTLLWTSAQATA